jgi:hypothetical protein
MATVLNHVQPGDIITAVSINSIIDQLKDLDSRLAKLEGGSPNSSRVVIDSLAPAGDLRIGDELTIFGQNFGYSIGAARVYFDTSPVTIFQDGSNDKRLIVVIPNVLGVSEQGTPVTLTVTNQISSDTRQVKMRPKVVNQQGNVALSFLGNTPVTITVGSTPTFTYELDAKSIFLQTTVTFKPTISITSLQNTLKVLDKNGTVLTNNQLPVSPGDTPLISVHADAIPAGTSSFTLTLKATASGMDGSQDTQSFSVGLPTPQPDPDLPILAFNAAAPTTVFDKNTNIITIPAGTTATIQFKAEFTGTNTRTYDLLASVVDPVSKLQATGWTAVISQNPLFPPTPDKYPISAPGTEFPAFDVTPQNNAASPSSFQVTLKRQNSNLQKSVQYEIHRG